MKGCLLLFLTYVICIAHTTAQLKECVANAHRETGGKKCVCDDGYHGNGNLCCIPEDHKTCLVEGDPVIKTMNGDLLPLDTPCPTLLTEVHTIGQNYDETVKAYVAGEYLKNGLMYMDYLRLEYEERYNDIHTIIEIFDGQLVINDRKHDKNVPWSSDKYEVSMNYSVAHDTYSMLSMGTTIVKFIPPSQKTDSQVTMPGICVGVHKQSLLYDTGMCNQRRRGLQRSSANKGFKSIHPGVVEHVIRILPLFQMVGPKYIRETCIKLNKNRYSCGRKWNPSIASCFAIISHPDIRYCLTRANLEVFEIFQACSEAHCGLSSKSCARIKSDAVSQCINVKPDCNSLYAP